MRNTARRIASACCGSSDANNPNDCLTNPATFVGATVGQANHPFLRNEDTTMMTSVTHDDVFDPDQISSNTSLEAMSRAEIDIQISTAKRYPRQLEKATAKMKAMVCVNEQAADSCFYVIPRDKKPIEGPSIRLAEIVAMNYGNIRIIVRIPQINEREIVVEWAAHDLESNYATAGSVSVRIIDKYGRRYNDDMIGVTGLAAGSKARRNAIFAIVPGTIVSELVNQARNMASGGDKPIEARRESAMKHFRKFGVGDDRILGAVNRTDIGQLTNDDLSDLRGMATAIKDGMTTIDESFPVIGGGDKAKSHNLAEKVGAKEKKTSADEKPAEVPAKPAPPVQQEDQPPATVATVAADEQQHEAVEPTTDKTDIPPAPTAEGLVTLYANKYRIDEQSAEARLNSYTKKIKKCPLAECDARYLANIEYQIQQGGIKPM